MAGDGFAIEGWCDPLFQEVATQFQRNFEVRDELGASVAIYFQGRLVVDLWGGMANAEERIAWTQDTIVTVFSCTKGLAAICLHMLIDKGMLDIEAPVARYWPEFASSNKADITVAMMLSHQAGLPYWQEDLPPGALFDDWDLMVSRLAAEPPVWEPGSTHGYHGSTIGFLEGELFRRITGQSLGQFFREQVAEPLDVHCWIGLPQSEEWRAARVYLAQPDPNSAFFRRLAGEPDWHGRKLATNTGSPPGKDIVNTRARHAAMMPAGNGMTNGRGLARAYAPLSLDGAVDGVRLVRKERLPAMRYARSVSSRDQMLQLPTSFTLGFSKSWGDRKLGPGEHVIIGEQAFGAPGMGGSIGFADGQAQMSFGYAMNRHGGGTGLNERGQSLVDAAYRAAGFANSDHGFWVRD